MRTTLTLDEDVAKLLEAARKRRKQGLKALVNEALRLGLLQLQRPTPSRGGPFTKVVSLGECRLADVDDIATVLAVGEGERFR